MAASPIPPLAPNGIAHQAKTLPVMIAIACVGVGAVLFGCAMLGASPAYGILGAVAIVVLLIGLWDPYWVLVLLLAQFALIPCEAPMFGVYIPNILQAGIPITFILALLHALKKRTVPRLIASDLLILAFGLWGLVGLAGNGALDGWKYYGNKILYPMGFYYIVRLVPLDHKRLVQAIGANLVCVALQGLLMTREAMVNSSPIYGLRVSNTAVGPFVAFWTAGAYMGLWPSLLILMTACSQTPARRLLWYAGLFLNVYAVTCTTQRGPTFAMIPVVLVCLLAPYLRRTAITVLILGGLAFLPWSMSSSGGALLERFDQTDESRVAYRAGALAVLSSSNWSPLYGVGLCAGENAMRHADLSHLKGRRVVMWGTREREIADVIEEGAMLHNVYLAVLVELGVVGALLALALVVALLRTLSRLYRGGIECDAEAGAIAVGIGGAFLALAGNAYLHNVWTMSPVMSVFWFLYGVVVGHPGAFATEATSCGAKEGLAASRQPTSRWTGESAR